MKKIPRDEALAAIREALIEYIDQQLADETLDEENIEDLQNLMAIVPLKKTLGEIMAIMKEGSWDIESAFIFIFDELVEGVRGDEFDAMPHPSLWDT